MKLNADRQRQVHRTAVLVTTVTLFAVTGCTTGNPGQTLSELLGDLARQLLAFWIL